MFVHSSPFVLVYCFVFSGVYGEYRLYKNLNQLKKQIMTTKPRICFICDQKADIHFPPHFLEVYGERLRNKGYQTSILAYAADINSDRAKKLMDNGVDLMSKAAPDNLAGRLFFYLKRSFGWMKVLWFKTGVKDADILFVHNDPLVGTLAWIKARLTGKKFIYRITHLMPEEALIRSDLKKHWKVLGKVAQRWRNWLIRRSDYVFVMSQQMAQTIYKQIPTLTKKLVPLESMLDFKRRPVADEALLSSIRHKQTQIGAEFWVSYVGTLSPGRELTLMIDMLHLLRVRGWNVGFLIFGVASKPEHLIQLKEYSEKQGVKKSIIWHHPVQEDQLQHVLSLSDIGISPFPMNDVMKNNSPLKILEYFRAGISVVASDIPDHKEVISGVGSGRVSAFNAEEFAEAVIYVLSAKLKKNASNKPSKWLVENRDLDTATSMIESALLL